MIANEKYFANFFLVFFFDENTQLLFILKLTTKPKAKLIIFAPMTENDNTYVITKKLLYSAVAARPPVTKNLITL